MPRFIDLTTSEKNELLIRASSTTKISPILLEKDFWVSWLLNKIFQMDISKNLIFKGGTSLSKCYGLITRFSEDIDITIDKSIFSNGINDSELSGKQFRKLLENNDEKAINFVQSTFKKTLEQAIKNHLRADDFWEIIPDDFEKKNLRFYYPTSINPQDNSYVKQSILIEIGVRGDISPCDDKEVISYVESQFGDLLESEKAKIKTLSPVRTFWEKITLLHAENNRPEDKQLGERMSRHYYDVHQMIKADISNQALKNMTLLHDVISNKKRYFKSSWSKYEEAVPGTLAIYPNEKLLKSLEADYRDMGLMIFGEIPDFSDIIQSIKKFEAEVNRLS